MSCDCVVSVESSPRGGWGENKGRSSGKRGVELVRPGIACYTPPPSCCGWGGDEDGDVGRRVIRVRHLDQTATQVQLCGDYPSVCLPSHRRIATLAAPAVSTDNSSCDSKVWLVNNLDSRTHVRISNTVLSRFPL